jgi:serine/threonine protein kinase
VIDGAGGLSISSGDVLGEFIVEGVIGRGGMGVVYRARQRRPERIVALKVIAPQLAGESPIEARFVREGTLAAQIEHPNVIPVYAVGEARGLLFIAMRFIDGTDLRTLLMDEQRLEPRRAALLVEQVAQALDAAHAHGLVHRDVKPANILVARVGGGEHVYLTDFGIARAMQSGATMTSTGALLGTLDYIAPEQARGEHVDGRADVYSLGCVLFEALTGTVPYPQDSHAAKLFAHVSEPPPSLLQRAGDLPAELDRVVLRAMAKVPDERYQSAGDLGRAAVVAASAATPSRSERGASRHDDTAVSPRARDSQSPSLGQGPIVARTPPTGLAQAASAVRHTVTSGRGRWVAILVAVMIGVGAIVAAAAILSGTSHPSRHNCGEISFAPGSTLASSDYGVGNIVATNTGCATARSVAAAAKDQSMRSYVDAGFSCTGAPEGHGSGAHTEWRCNHRDELVTFFSIGV